MNRNHFALKIAPPVADALANGQPVVALESTVVAHGLPFPKNLEVAEAIEKEVTKAGAVPATIGIIDGVPTIGLDHAALSLFAEGKDVLKISRRDIGHALAAKKHGATTVAATMALAKAAGIEFFATGGIGGVHLGARESWDVSADILELSRTPVLVVCAGAKAILDLPATLELLETFGVPVFGYRCDEFPAFYTSQSELSISHRVDTPEQAFVAWDAHKAYGGGSGALLTVPPPADAELDWAVLNEALATALIQADEMNVRGQAVTPFLLRKVSELTGGDSVKVNIALLLQNARVAAQVACAGKSATA